MNNITTRAGFTIVLGLAGAALLLFETDDVSGAGKPLPTVLESGNNDVIRVVKGKAAIRPPRLGRPEPAAGDAGLKPGSSHLVTICLKNSSRTAGHKAFDIRRTARPRYLVKRGTQICANFVPVRQSLNFWKTGYDGKLSLTLSQRFDLRGMMGRRIRLDWVRD